MKFFLLIILFAFFIFFAICVYMYFSYRYKVFFDTKYICKYLKNNISFNKSNLNDLLTKCFSEISSSSKYIFKNLSSPFSNLILKKDKKVVYEFFKSLGKGDVGYEINNLNYYTNIFDELKIKAEIDQKNKAMMYFKLIIGLGLIVCIILI